MNSRGSRLGTSRLATGTKRPTTAVGPTPTHYSQIKPGYVTQTIYTLISNNNHISAIKLLETMPSVRSTLSLLGYCLYAVQDYSRCINVYTQLMDICPNNPIYRFNYCQSLYHAGNYDAALRFCNTLTESNDNIKDITMLKISILFEMDELEDCLNAIEKSRDESLLMMARKASVLARVIAQFKVDGEFQDFTRDLYYYLRQDRVLPSACCLWHGINNV